MKPDDNWRETRILAEDLEILLGVPVKTTEDYLTIIENLIVHKFVEEIGNEEFDNKDCQIELPYLGSMIVSVNEGQVSINFAPRNTLYRKIKTAYSKRESPLTTQCAKILGEQLVERYEET